MLPDAGKSRAAILTRSEAEIVLPKGSESYSCAGAAVDSDRQ